MNHKILSSRRNESDVWREDNVIFIRGLTHPRHASQFIKVIYHARKCNYESVIINMNGVSGVFPNACVPIAAAIQYYKDSSLNILVEKQSYKLENAHFNKPLLATSDVLNAQKYFLSKIWEFNNDKMVFELVSALVKAIVEKVECSAGVLQGFEWCLNEVMDNVLQHSRASRGFVMVQVHAESKRIAVCITDTGIGIYGSLADSKHKPKSAVDAITLAVKEGVTRDSSIGQGNGLWGLFQIVKNNSGRLSITSGQGSLFIRGDETKTFDDIPYIDKNHKGTIVDFQIDASQIIDITNALNGFKPVNLRLESLENDTGEHHIIVREYAHGTGTRRAAE
ncbi:MAG: ATP-binding protein [Nostoc sp.]|uniref:ATP-binding protein n=1 Tax=Nostoc sp. TaxID=1180 RepID=UPI002FF08B35